jgi:hypothetical protein
MSQWTVPFRIYITLFTNDFMLGPVSSLTGNRAIPHILTLAALCHFDLHGLLRGPVADIAPHWLGSHG